MVYLYFSVIQLFPALAFVVWREIESLKRRSFELPIGSEDRMVCIEEVADLKELCLIYFFAWCAFMLAGLIGFTGGW